MIGCEGVEDIECVGFNLYWAVLCVAAYKADREWLKEFSWTVTFRPLLPLIEELKCFPISAYEIARDFPERP
ncbi:MAG: hypothetical protein V4568_15015 [Pseudomonadota bacterium]